MTNGIVSLTVGGKTVLKFIAGCDGYNADSLGVLVRRFIQANGRMPTGEEALELAHDAGFGCDACTVIQDVARCYTQCEEGAEPTHALYLQNGPFEKPEFNPRWKVGTAAHVVVIDMEEFALATT